MLHATTIWRTTIDDDHADPAVAGASGPARRRSRRSSRPRCDLMREQRTTDIRFTDIAKSMGLTPPALYRYFDGRDELLTALITDAYDELGERRPAGSLTASTRRDCGTAGSPPARPTASWARERAGAVRADPRACRCRATSPTRTARPPRRPSGPWRSCPALFVERPERGRLGPPLIREVDPSLAACAEEKHPDELDRRPAGRVVPGHAARLGRRCTASPAWRPTATWTGSAPEARDALFRAQLQLIAWPPGCRPAS